MTFFLVNVVEGAETDVVAAGKKMLAYIDGVYIKDVQPELSNLINKIAPDEVAVLTPFAKEAFEEIVADIPAFFAGGIASFIAAVGPVLGLTVSKAVAAGVQVAEADALTAVNAVVANANVAATAPAPTTPPPAPDAAS